MLESNNKKNQSYRSREHCDRKNRLISDLQILKQNKQSLSFKRKDTGRLRYFLKKGGEQGVSRAHSNSGEGLCRKHFLLWPAQLGQCAFNVYSDFREAQVYRLRRVEKSDSSSTNKR
jgi:hypothetical protein